MAGTINPQDIANAKIDIEDIGESVNEAKVITPRYGAPFKSIPMTVAEMQEAIERAAAAGAGENGWTDLLIQTVDGSTQRTKNASFQAQIDQKVGADYVDAQDSLKADKSYVDARDASLQSQINQKASAAYLDAALDEQTETVNTALSNLSTTANKYYSTLAAANADIANIELNQSVTIGEEANSGLWEKKTAGATTLTKSPYDPLTQAKEYSKSIVYSDFFGYSGAELKFVGSLSNPETTTYLNTGLLQITGGLDVTIQAMVFLSGASYDPYEFYDEDSQKITVSYSGDTYKGLFTKTVKAPENAAYIKVMSVRDTHPNYTPYEFKISSYKRFDEPLKDEVSGINKRIELIESGNVIVVGETAFTNKVGVLDLYRTAKIETQGLDFIYLRGSARGGSGETSVLRAYDEDDNITGIETVSSTTKRYSNMFTLPAGTVFVEITLLTSATTPPDFSVELGALAVLGKTEDEIIKKLFELDGTSESTSFPAKNVHAFSAATTYDSTRIALYPSLSVSYVVNARGGSGAIRQNNAIVERLYDNSGVVTFNDYGILSLSTFNESHELYDPDFVAKYARTKATDQVKVEQHITSAYLPTPTLKAVREIVFKDGTQKTAIQYLWHDHSNNFFVSSTIRGDKKFIFKFNPQNFYDTEPYHWSMNFDRDGNIVCVHRIEHYSLTGNTDSVRKNPIVLVKNEDYKAVVVDFGENLKPSGWLQNCGFMCTDEYIMLTEYTRPSVATANTWKATYPLTNPENWKTVQSFPLSPLLNPPDTLKHIHNVDMDPYTGYIYTSTGDNDAGAAIYMSKDDGETFTSILSGSEKYCRVLNWVFTKDWIYWATDSTGLLHGFFKAPRNSSGEMDTSNITDILIFPTESWATYATIYMPKINALVFLGRSDSASTALPVDVYDLKNENFIKIDTLKPVDNVAANFGFRCECFEWIPRGNEIACGFSRTLGPGGYENRIGILGNTSDVTKKVNNLILTVDRTGDDFTISYDTAVL